MVSILIIDDEEDIREILKYNLEKEGFYVETAIDSENGLAKMKIKKPDLLILDVMMPGMDGIEFCELVRHTPGFEQIVICLLTARNEDYSQIAGLDSGADDYVAKPVKPKVLVSRINALLRRKGKVDPENFILKHSNFEKTLTKKEAQILKVLYKFKNQVIERDVVLNAVWGQDDYFVGRSLDVFITKLRKYLKDDTNVELLNVHGNGYRLVVKD